MAGVSVLHAFGQSTYTYVTDSSYCAGLDRNLSYLVPPKGVPRTKIISSFSGANRAKSMYLPPIVKNYKKIKKAFLSYEFHWFLIVLLVSIVTDYVCHLFLIQLLVYI